MTRRVAAITLVGLVVVSVAARTVVWPPSNTPDHVDAIVVLGGGEPIRLQTGLALFADEVGDVLVLSAGTAEAAAGHGVHCDDATVVCVAPVPETIAGEARTITTLATGQGWSSLAVVTSTTTSAVHESSSGSASTAGCPWSRRRSPGRGSGSSSTPPWKCQTWSLG